jgi:hypothetical protein
MLINHQIRQEYLSEPNEQKIARLEAQKIVWTRKRDELVKKIDQLDAKKTFQDTVKDS